MILRVLLAILGCYVAATTPYQLDFIDAIKQGDIQKVSEMMTAVSYEVLATEQEEQAAKRRRLDPIDPSFCNNLAIFTAISSSQREIAALLFRDKRVKHTVHQRKLTKKCIEKEYNDLARPYLTTWLQGNFTSLFSRAIVYNNIEILELLACDSRVNLKEAVTISLSQMTRFEKIDDLFNFFTENSHIRGEDSGKFLLLQLAHTNKSMSHLLKLYSLAEFWPEVEHMRELLQRGEYEVPILVMSRSSGHFEIFKRLLGRDIRRFADPMLWFNEASLEQLKESKEQIDTHKTEIQNSFFVVACCQGDTEKLKFLLTLNYQISSKMVTMLVAFVASRKETEDDGYFMFDKEKMETMDEMKDIGVFEVLLSTPSVLSCLDEQNFNSLTEWFIQKNLAAGQIFMVHILSQTIKSFSTLHARLMELNSEPSELIEMLDELSNTIDALQHNGLKGLSAVARLALAHHTAMVIIASQGIFLPREIRTQIFAYNQDSLRLYYKAN